MLLPQRPKSEASGLILVGAKQYLARVLFSDSHTLTALGKNASGQSRMTRLKMDAPRSQGCASPCRTRMRVCESKMRFRSRFRMFSE